jgi:hypothetical protein
LAEYEFVRVDRPHEKIKVNAKGRKIAKATAVVKFGLNADQVDLVRQVGRNGRRKRNGNKPWKPERSGIGFNRPGERHKWW